MPPKRSTTTPSSARKGKGPAKQSSKKSKASSQSQPPPVESEYDTSDNSEDFPDDMAVVDNRGWMIQVQSSTLHEAQEKDFRKVFASPIGDFFRNRLIQKGWDKLFGSDDWFVNSEYVNLFRNHLTISKNTLELRWSSHGRRHRRRLTPNFLSNFTDIPATCDRPDWAFLENMDKPLTPELARRVAPYHTSAHLDGPPYNLKVNGMQANVMAITKWACVNIFGTYTTSHINGRVAWFIDCLIHDTFPTAFDIHALLIWALRSHLASCFPLPALTTAIAAHCWRQKHVSDVKKHQGLRATLLRSDIGGFFDGTVYAEGHASRPTVNIGGDGADVKSLLFPPARPKKTTTSSPVMQLQDATVSEDHVVQPSDANLNAASIPSHYTTFPPFQSVFGHPGAAPSNVPLPPLQPPFVSEPYPQDIPFESYLNPEYATQLSHANRVRFITAQNSLILQSFQHQFLHSDIGFPQYHGFRGLGFPAAPVADTEDDDTADAPDA